MFVLMLYLACIQDHDMITASWQGSLTAEQARAWRTDRVYPTYFDIEVHQSMGDSPPLTNGVPLDVLDSTGEDNSARWSQFTGALLRDALTEKDVYDAMFFIETRHEKVRRPWDRVRMQYWVRPGSIFPLPDGRVYRASFGKNVLRLTNVTETLPDQDRPRKTSLTISGNCRESRYPQGILDSAKFGRIRILMKVDEVAFSGAEMKTATVSWSRNDDGGSNRPVDKKGWAEYHAQFNMSHKGTITMTIGNEISTGYRKYKVLNVIPPSDLNDGGHCEGWVELEERERPNPEVETSQ